MRHTTPANKYRSCRLAECMSAHTYSRRFPGCQRGADSLSSALIRLSDVQQRTSDFCGDGGEAMGTGVVGRVRQQAGEGG